MKNGVAPVVVCHHPEPRKGNLNMGGCKGW
jgi:hypothetical protein